MPNPTKKSSINKRQRSRQNSLNSKLKERLGYAGIYSQRDDRQFLENLSLPEQQKLMQELKTTYYQIFIDYFTAENKTNHRIDRFVEKAFFVNLPIGKVVEIHMELVDELAHKLKLEGLKTEYLCDYRLTLIDVIAHLGEMYRRTLKDAIVPNDSY